MAVSAAIGSVTLAANGSLPITTGVVTPFTILAQVQPGALTYTNGTGASSFDILYQLVSSLAAAPSTLDFSSVLDVRGTSRTPLRCRELILWIDPTDVTITHTITVAPGLTNPWLSAPTFTMYPGTVYRVVSDPLSVGGGVGAVIGGSNKTITFDPGANTIGLRAIGYFCSAVT